MRVVKAVAKEGHEYVFYGDNSELLATFDPLIGQYYVVTQGAYEDMIEWLEANDVIKTVKDPTEDRPKDPTQTL